MRTFVHRGCPSPRCAQVAHGHSLSLGPSYGIMDRRVRLYCSTLSRRSYDDAVGLLNSLQTPHQLLQARRQAGVGVDVEANDRLRACLHHLGYSVSDVDRLNIVHVTGTKGKGSTCTYVDSILNQYRLSRGLPRKVGLFTSPHLISVRERIKINSIPLSPEKFTRYFFDVWNRLETPVTEHGRLKFLEKPVYFRFLTLMSYHVFIQEGVTSAIYEVGVGGENDATNIVERPAATGISTIGIDHTFILGNTVSKIAWHKAGIIKKDSPNFYVPQDSAAIAVIAERARERESSSSQIVEPDRRLNRVKIRPDALFQRRNATLAISLSDAILSKLMPEYEALKLTSDQFPQEVVDGLEKAVCRGRCEVKKEKGSIWYLDGAHTIDSIEVATAWFANEMLQQNQTRDIRILIFNQQGDREPLELLDELYKQVKKNRLQFDHVIFCPTVSRMTETKRDLVNLAADQLAIAGLTLQKKFARRWQDLDGDSAQISALASVDDAIDLARELGSESCMSHVFVTGSIHLVGRALGIIEGVDAL